MDKKGAVMLAGATAAAVLGLAAVSHAQAPPPKGHVTTSVSLDPVSPKVGEDTVATVSTEPATPGLSLTLLSDGAPIGDFPPTGPGGRSTLAVVFNQAGSYTLEAVKS